jgi:hypothetical protein
MVQNVQAKLSYKSKKKIALEKEFWITVPNTHEALVSKEIFERIQGSIKRTKKTFAKRDKRLFENLLFCKECGNMLTLTYRKNKDYWTINCNKYSRDPKRRLCEPHFMPYDKLEKALLDTIKSTCREYFESIDIKKLAKDINDKKQEKDNIIEEKNFLKNKIKEYISKIDMLYEDKFNGTISDMVYKRLSKDTELLLNQAEARLEELTITDKKVPNIMKNLKKYESKIKELVNIEKPARELLQTIIEKIIIDKDKKIEIIYKFILLN